MIYSDFRFIDTAFGGATNRNNVIDLNDLSVSADVVNAYTTMFRFRQEYKKHVDKTGSVRGADQFECWSDYLWFDIDADDLNQATIDMQTLLRGLEILKALKHTVVFFSGSKGYHVGIDSSVFGFKPSQTLPNEMRCTALAIAKLFNIKIDSKIYNHNRLWRISDSLHKKTKLRKTQIVTGEALSLSLDKIKVLAGAERQLCSRFTLCDNASPVDMLVQLREKANVGESAKPTGWEPPPRNVKQIEAGLRVLLNQGVTKGDRDDEALLRASECRKVGLNENDCLIALFTWNTLNKPELTDGDVRRIVKSAYTGEGYDFGTNNDSLRAAREQGHKVAQEIDVEKLLSDEEPPDTEEKCVRRSRTVSELLAGGIDLTMPETVGEYISWRKRITLLAGREKTSGKSTLCTFEAMAALRKGYRVLWVSPDEPCEDILYRLVEAGVREYAEQCEIAGDLDVPRGWTELAQMIVDAKPDLVILDSIHSILPMVNESGRVPDSSESAEWHKLVACLRPLAVKLNIAIVWIHHVTKATGQAAGSFGIAAAVDVVVTISPVQKDNRRKLEFVGRRVNSSMNCALDYLDEERGYERVKDWGKDMERDSEQSKAEQVFNWLREFIDLRQGEHFTRHDMDEAFRNQYNTDPRNSSALRNALKKIKDDGEIVQDKSNAGVAKTTTYRIVNKKLKPSDLTGEDSDDE